MLPEHLKQEVADFVAFLSLKNRPNVRKDEVAGLHEDELGPAISETALQEDWADEDHAHWERFLKD